ncbi:MAG: prepilin-type N-terminal cleavage/methylation domain-containing protein [Fimbriimonadaceae bacterium]|nr:MAG: prepilin-type N-terminal cleavage/methylation domain-containing protein [Fimbriimonadaceae bacterium]
MSQSMSCPDHSPIKVSCRSAFTLIELLVVIAIIAILAAILFPVFARAKVAAKSTVSVSNIKQQALSILMYATDYDDMFVVTGQWGSTDPDACQRYASVGGQYMPWTGLVEPYKKNNDINASPFTGNTRPFVWTTINRCFTKRQCDLLYPNYGYNGVMLSPSYDPDRRMMPISTTEVAKAGETVMLTEIWSRNVVPTGAAGAGAFNQHMGFASAEPPGVCRNEPGVIKPKYTWCWGVGWADAQFPVVEEGKYTGGIAFRHNNQTPVAFTDGHVRKMSREALAVGTNYIFGITEYPDVVPTYEGKHLWDPAGVW